jgi:hypothetical protein
MVRELVAYINANPGTSAPTSSLLFASQHLERFAAEMGQVSGPSRVGLILAVCSGLLTRAQWMHGSPHRRLLFI